VEWLSHAAEIATVVGVPVGLGALVYAGLQLRHSADIARGRFMLELERMTAAHDPVHIRLRPGGIWSEASKGPASGEEWAEVDDYMGFFEHCELLLRERALDLTSFKALFEYRIRNITANSRIVDAKLIDEKASWTLFLELLDRLEMSRPLDPTGMFENPVSIAARLHAEHHEADVVLVDRADSETTFEVRDTTRLVGIVSANVAVGHFVLSEDERWVVFDVRPDQDHTMFVVDGPKVRHITIAQLRIVSASEFQEHHRAAVDEADHDSEPQDTGADSEMKAFASLDHLSGEHVGGDWLGVTVGLPESRLTDLIDICRASTCAHIWLRGYLGAHTVRYFPYGEDDHPIILFANQRLEFAVDELTITDRLTN